MDESGVRTRTRTRSRPRPRFCSSACRNSPSCSLPPGTTTPQCRRRDWRGCHWPHWRPCCAAGRGGRRRHLRNRCGVPQRQTPLLVALHLMSLTVSKYLAAATVALSSAAGLIAIGALFGAAGAGLTGYKMVRRRLCPLLLLSTQERPFPPPALNSRPRRPLAQARWRPEGVLLCPPLQRRAAQRDHLRHGLGRYRKGPCAGLH